MCILIYKVGFVPAGNRETRGWPKGDKRNGPTCATLARTVLLRRVNQRDIEDECLWCATVDTDSNSPRRAGVRVVLCVAL